MIDILEYFIIVNNKNILFTQRLNSIIQLGNTMKCTDKVETDLVLVMGSQMPNTNLHCLHGFTCLG